MCSPVHVHLRACASAPSAHARPLAWKHTRVHPPSRTDSHARTHTFVHTGGPAVSRFLNRLLGLPQDTQTLLLDYFMAIHESVVKAARADGTYDEGIQEIRGTGVKFDPRSPQEVMSSPDALPPADDEEDDGEGKGKDTKGKGKKKSAPKNKAKKEGKAKAAAAAAAAAAATEEDDDVQVVGAAAGGTAENGRGALLHWFGVCDKGTPWAEALKIQQDAVAAAEAQAREEPPEDAWLNRPQAYRSGTDMRTGGRNSLRKRVTNSFFMSKSPWGHPYQKQLCLAVEYKSRGVSQTKYRLFRPRDRDQYIYANNLQANPCFRFACPLLQRSPP